MIEVVLFAFFMRVNEACADDPTVRTGYELVEMSLPRQDVIPIRIVLNSTYGRIQSNDPSGDLSMVLLYRFATDSRTKTTLIKSDERRFLKKSFGLIIERLRSRGLSSHIRQIAGDIKMDEVLSSDKSTYGEIAERFDPLLGFMYDSLLSHSDVRLHPVLREILRAKDYHLPPRWVARIKTPLTLDSRGMNSAVDF